MKKGGIGRVLLRANIAFYGGLILLLLCWMMISGGGSEPWMGWMVLAVVGAIASFGALFYCWAAFRCPYCNASLMPGHRMPTRVPAYCSACGAHLEDTE